MNVTVFSPLLFDTCSYRELLPEEFTVGDTHTNGNFDSKSFFIPSTDV